MMENQELSRLMGERLDALLRTELFGADAGASTAASAPEAPSLTYEGLLETVRELERLKPTPIYYYASEGIPKRNKDGGNFIAKITMGDDDVFFFHPDWLPFIKSKLGECVYLLTEFDMERYGREQAERELLRPRSPSTW